MKSDEPKSTSPIGPRRLLQVDAAWERDFLQPILSAAAENGFDGVDIRLCPEGSGPARADSMIPTWLVGVCEEMGLSVLGLTAACSGFEASRASDEVCRLLQLAQSAGASFLNLQIPKPGDAERQGGGQVLVNFLHRLLQLVTLDVEASGAVLALAMPQEGTFLSAVELRELIDGAHSWAVGACVDAGSVGVLVDWIPTLDRRVFTVRLDDMPTSPGSAAVADNRADEFRRALQAIGFEGALVFGSVETLGMLGEVIPLQD